MPVPNIPEAEYEILAKPPLKAMLGQVRFPPILKIADVSALAAFQDALRGSWPEFSPEQQVSLLLGPGSAPTSSGVQQIFRFTSADKAWSALLAPDVLTLEAAVGGAYSSYDDFTQRFKEVWSVFLEHFRPTSILRQGLRYVDHLEGTLDPVKWSELINPELLGALAGPLAPGLEQSVSEYRFRYDEGVLVFKHGILPAGPENTNGYLLDYDYFTDQPTEEVALEPLLDRFGSYHAQVYALFRWCVTDQALEGFRDGS